MRGENPRLLNGFLAVALLGAVPVLAQIPRATLSHPDTFVLQTGGQAVLFNPAGGVEGTLFADSVYKPFGLSADARYFLFLKARGGLPAFDLAVLDVESGKVRDIPGHMVHHAAWAPDRHRFAFVSLDANNTHHLLVHDLDTGSQTEIAAGNIRQDFISWSEDGTELLYITMAALSRDAAERGSFTPTLHRQSLLHSRDTAYAGVRWAQFDEGQLYVAGAAPGAESIPNPEGARVLRFARRSGRLYASILGSAGESVALWNEAAGRYETVAQGHLFADTRGGVLIRRFTRAGVEYARAGFTGAALARTIDFTAAKPGRERAARHDPNAIGDAWKPPYHGAAFVVQGGALYSDGSCDGTQCLLTAHFAELGYALDFQQQPELNQGNTHILAVEQGTVAAVSNNIACNNNTTTCSVGWDDYSPSCNNTNDGAGNYVSIAHLDGSYSFYAHLRSASIPVTAGQTVSQGQYIGDQGHSGAAGTYNNYRSCGDHLHFSRQIGAAVWAQSAPTDFAELPCLLGCPATAYNSSNVELAAAPALTSIAPSSGLQGAAVTVTLTGQRFLYGTTISISGTGVTASNILLTSATSLTATFNITAAAAAGARTVSVTTAAGTSNTVNFTVNALPPGEAVWHSYSIVTQAGSPQATVTDVSGTRTATVELYQSTNVNGVTKGSLFQAFNSGLHSETFNNVRDYWGPSAGPTYPYAGKSSVARGSDTGESNTPSPAGVFDLQLHPPGSDHLTVAAFRVPQSGTYEVSNLAVRRVDSNAGQTVRFLVFNSSQTQIANLQASNNRAWTTNGATLAVGTLSVGDSLYFAVARDGQYWWDATEIAFTVRQMAAAPDFALTSTPASRTIAAGATASFTATVAPLNGFTGTVTLSASGLPSGASASFSPGTVMASGNSTLTVTTTTAVTPGSYPLTITGTSGALIHTAAVTIVVDPPPDFTISATPASQSVAAGASTTYTATVGALNGFSGTVSLSASGLPSGASASFSPGTVTASGNSTLTVSTTAVTPPGTYTIDVTGTSGAVIRTATVSLTVSNTPDFTLAAAPSSRTITAGTGTSYTATVTPQNGFTGTASFSVSGLPTGATASFAPATVTTSGTATLSVNTTPSVIPGTYSLTITATSGALVRTAPVTLIVTAPPDFSLSVTPASQTVVAGGSTSYSAAITPMSGFTGTVSFSASGLPGGTSASFSPATIAGSGNSTLTVTTTAAATPGTHTVTVTGVSGALTRMTTVSLVIQTAPPVGESVWNSYSVVSQAGSPQGTVLDVAGVKTANIEFYESTNNNGVARSALFSTFNTGLHSDAFNNLLDYWAPSSGAAYPYAGKSSSGRGSDTGETNAPVPAGVFDLQLHAPNNDHLTVAAFRVPEAGVYSVSNLAVRRVDGNSAQTARYLVFGHTQTQIANLQASSNRAWVSDPSTYTLGSLAVGDYIYFGVARDGQYWWDATEIAWSIRRTAPAPDFTLSAAPSSRSVAAGTPASYSATVAPLNGFTGTVSLAVSGMPSGVTGTFTPATVTTSGSSTLNLAIGSGTTPGTYALTITGTSGALARTATVTLTVTGPPDFTLNAAPSSVTISPGSATSYTATVAALNGFSGVVSFSVSGLPAGATGAFSPATVTASGLATLSISTTAAVATGTYPLTITATSGALVRTAGVALAIQTGPPPQSTWNSYSVTTQAGSPQGTVIDTNGVRTATVEFYESTNDGGVTKGSLFSSFNAGSHGQAFNNVQAYWGPAAGAVYPYAGKSTVGRGSDTGETNAPAPAGVFDLQLHPPNNGHLTVAAFRVPEAGNYEVSNLAVRRVDGNAGQTSRLLVFDHLGVQIANLQASSNRAWVTQAGAFTINGLAAGSYIYFAAGRDGQYWWDATEVAWTVRRTGP